jgi:hypothetical protein
MTYCHRSKVLSAYLDSITYVEIQSCLLLLIGMNILRILSACSKASYYTCELHVYRR